MIKHILLASNTTNSAPIDIALSEETQAELNALALRGKTAKAELVITDPQGSKEPCYTGTYNGVAIPVYRDEVNGHYRYRVWVNRYTAKESPKYKSISRSMARAKACADERAREVASEIRSEPKDQGKIWYMEQIISRLASEGLELEAVIGDAIYCANALKSAYGASALPTPRQIAEEQARRHIVLATIRKPATVNELLARFQALVEEHSKKGVCVPSQNRRTDCQPVHFAKKFGERFIHTVTAPEMLLWCEERIAAGMKRETVRQYFAEIKTFFKFAREEGTLPLSLSQTEADQVKIPQPTRLNRTRRTSKRLKLLKVEQVAEIMRLGWTNEKFRPWIVILACVFFGGIHFTELLQLTYGDIERSGELKITKEIAQEHAGRTMVFSPAQFTFIEENWRATAPETPLVPGFDPKRPALAQYDALHGRFVKIMKEILKAVGETFNDNLPRHEFASMLLALCWNVDYSCLQMGTQKANAMKFYIDAASHEDALAYSRIARPGVTKFKKLMPADWLTCRLGTREQAVTEIQSAVAKGE